MKKFVPFLVLFIGSAGLLFGNGGAWQEGVPATGTASASEKEKAAHKTDVTIENETLSIDLHSEYAVVEVHYQMHNTGAKTQQDFFFPVERWENPPGEEGGKPAADLGHYQITADGKELKWTDVRGPKSKDNESPSGEFYEEPAFKVKWWKKSVIPFEKDQRREIVIKYGSRYSKNAESVSEDEHVSDATFSYSLSPAATWKGPIAKGTIDINISHNEPEDVSIAKPKDRFKKLSDTHFQWIFENLKPSQADDIKIVAHSKYDEYPAGYGEEELRRHVEYVLREHQYFLDHTNYDAKASSTLAPQGERKYDVDNIKADTQRDLQTPWAEGVEGDGIGENISLEVKRPLPLYAIMIRPGYYDYDREDIWWKNNRVASLEITLNDEHTFTENIPDERFEDPYLIRVRGYDKPVNKVKLVIKGVHPGKEFHDTCISLVQLRAALTEKPEVKPAR